MREAQSYDDFQAEGPHIHYRRPMEVKRDVEDYNELVAAICDLRQQVFDLRKRLDEHESSL